MLPTLTAVTSTLLRCVSAFAYFPTAVWGNVWTSKDSDVGADGVDSGVSKGKGYGPQPLVQIAFLTSRAALFPSDPVIPVYLSTLPFS